MDSNWTLRIGHENLEDMKRLYLNGFGFIPQEIHMQLQKRIISNVLQHDPHELSGQQQVTEKLQGLTLGDIITFLQELVVCRKKKAGSYPPGTRRKCHDVSAKNRATMQKHQTRFQILHDE